MRKSYQGIQVRAEAMKLFADAFAIFPSIAAKYVERLSRARAVGYLDLDAWLAVYRDVLADIGPNALFQMGHREVSNPNFNAATRTLEEALRQIDIAYHKSHRKGGALMYDLATGRMLEGIGHYAVDRSPGEKKITIVCDTPYPCPLERGIIAGVAGQFEPRAIVAHLAEETCRMKGGDACTYIVSW